MFVDVNLPGNRTISRNGQISLPLSQNLENRKKSDGIGLYVGGGSENCPCPSKQLDGELWQCFFGIEKLRRGLDQEPRF